MGLGPIIEAPGVDLAQRSLRALRRFYRVRLEFLPADPAQPVDASAKVRRLHGRQDAQSPIFGRALFNGSYICRMRFKGPDYEEVFYLLVVK